ncbi:NUMOD1 domain-containing DNA-binding protein [uncultured Thomasclavelia sp.]|uniref:NUMOD1 domain-containing DNA-binding protein n=1 Tax=uncultured Thomasclavelia sp. TaxID=3025759 RepID=UPI002599A1DE|nr:NUMOD1 domain-containing DNA-binding protein [uncultured Thomasclavelia sp.]
MIAMYDLEDNLITVFENYRECAKYFNTTSDSIHSHISRFSKGILKKKLDKQNKRWVRLFKIKE